LETVQSPFFEEGDKSSVTMVGDVSFRETHVLLVFILRKIFIIKSIKREQKTRPIYDCRCDERLKPKDDESTCLACRATHLVEELEYPKIETRLIDEKFASVMGECVI
jgi:hypothetical protein